MTFIEPNDPRLEDLLAGISDLSKPGYRMVTGTLRRRESTTVVEVLAIPLLQEVTVMQDMFDDKHNRTQWIDQVSFWARRLGNNGLMWEPIDDGSYVNSTGLDVVQLKYLPAGWPVEIFLVEEEAQWGIALALTTGPPDVAKRLGWWCGARGFLIQHFRLHSHLSQHQNCPKGDHCPLIIETPDEMTFFEVLGLDYIEPDQRTRLRMRDAEKKALGLSSRARW